MENNISRRLKIKDYTSAELSIYNAIKEVEKLKADIRLTEASCLLVKAKDMVSDFVGGYETVLPKSERFKMPTDEQVINIAIIFNHGILDKHKLSDMVSMCQFVIDRLYENGDILKPSKKE